jgi:hypothetical protein
MNPTLRKMFDIFVMLMWMIVGIIVPLNLSAELRAQAWVAVAVHLATAAILWFGWWAEGKHTRSRAFSFATLWFIPLAALSASSKPFWPWSASLWPWLTIFAGLAGVACICLSEQASAVEDKVAGKEPATPVSKLRMAMSIGCMVIWAGSILYEGWPESLTQQLWAKLAINVIAVGSIWLFWVLNPERPRTWPKLGYYVFFSCVTVMMLGAGISPWAWRNDTFELAFMVVTAVFGLTLYLKNWRASRAR